MLTQKQKNHSAAQLASRSYHKLLIRQTYIGTLPRFVPWGLSKCSNIPLAGAVQQTGFHCSYDTRVRLDTKSTNSMLVQHRCATGAYIHNWTSCYLSLQCGHSKAISTTCRIFRDKFQRRLSDEKGKVTPQTRSAQKLTSRKCGIRVSSSLVVP